MLQAGRLLVQIPIMSKKFSIYLILPAALMALGMTQSLIEMSTRISFWSKVPPTHIADNPITICVSQLSRKCRIVNISQPHRTPQTLTGIALLFTYSFTHSKNA
jgi:hypothetical protein